MPDELRDSIASHLRLELSPETLTVDDVKRLGESGLCLRLRAAVAYELRRLMTPTKTPTKKTASRRKAARHATR